MSNLRSVAIRRGIVHKKTVEGVKRFNYRTSLSTRNFYFISLFNDSLSIEKSEIAIQTIRSSHPEVFLRKCALKICSKFTGEHPY